jgi:hypothetical protein
MAAIDELPRVGLDNHLYYNTGDRTTPVLVEVTRAKNVNFSSPAGEAEQLNRSSKWKLKRKTSREFEITFSYDKKGGTDTVFDYLQAASIADTIVDLWMLDGTSIETGAQGPRSYSQLFDLSLAQELEAIEEVEFVAKGTYQETGGSQVEPDWYEVT